MGILWTKNFPVSISKNENSERHEGRSLIVRRGKGKSKHKKNSESEGFLYENLKVLENCVLIESYIVMMWVWDGCGWCDRRQLTTSIEHKR